MRLYILAIGGTGSRVLQSLVMQLASGIIPNDPATNKPMENVSIVPIIIDPHKDNDAVQKTNTLLMRYRDIRHSLYGERPSLKGFYGIRIESLKDVTTDKSNNTTYKISDSFIYDMPAIVSSRRFREFIGIDSFGFDESAKQMSKMLFSSEELSTQMSEGFYGSPNIGTIALNVFKNSDSYTALGERFQEGDRMFFIGSIFGGTGASGLPMLVSSIRQDPKYTKMSNAYMGALVVMPYFSIQNKENSEIQESDFVIKTKTALKYYEENLYDYLNATYYVADMNRTVPFENDPGKNNQKTNKAHFVEFIGGLAIMNFLNQISKGDGHDVIYNKGRKEAAGHKYMQFEIKEDETSFGFSELGKETNELIFRPMVAFHYLKRFIADGYFQSNMSATFVKNGGIDATAVTDDMLRFFEAYAEWLEELSDHGDGAHNFIPFNVNTSTNFSKDINGVPMKKGTFVSKTFIMKGCCILSKPFSSFSDDHVVFIF